MKVKCYPEICWSDGTENIKEKQLKNKKYENKH